ncbi:MAG: toxin-antitoxin system YwqK family antitoxin [Bacteroidota bacterium]
MTREEHLKFCKKCTNRKMDLRQGLLCSLTGEKADFENECENFIRDESVKEEIEVENRPVAEILTDVPEDIKEDLKSHQDLVYAIIGGLFLSVISALIWAVITVSTEYQIGYMAIGVGLLVGMGVRYFGAGIDPIFGYLGAAFALLGCALGNLFSQVGFIAEAQALGYFETLALLDTDTIILIYQDSFNPMDLLFYGIAVFEGYKFAFRPIPSNIKHLDDYTPAYSNLRLPLVIVFFVALTISGYSLSKGVSGDKTFYYENGAKQSEGELINGAENGLWNYYYENGSLQITGNYINGVENGLWKWYYESGELKQTGNYKNGMLDGTWLNYNVQGILVDSSNFIIGRLNGGYNAFYDNGSIFQSGTYKRDKQVGEWKVYHENGKLSAIGSFEDGELNGIWKYTDLEGNPTQELNYLDDESIRIINAWDNKGNQIVENGFGEYVSHYDDNVIFQQGRVSDGEKIGEWKTYHPNGKIREIGEFKKDIYYIISAWGSEGDIMVEGGNGEYSSSFENSNNSYETGNVKDGLKDGIWFIYFPDALTLRAESNYLEGKHNGKNVAYFANGNIESEGHFVNDLKEGEWKWYHENGIIQCTIKYEKDLKQGDQIFWSEMGREAKKETYVDGEFKTEVLL